jgi:hypothetical protein
MKERKNKSRQSEQQKKKGAEKQDVSLKRTAGSTRTEDTSRQAGGLNIPEKKPYSHRTGDATNFGDRSYRED